LNKFGIFLGTLLVLVAAGAAAMPLEITLHDPTRTVVIYPNLLFVIPMILLGSLLLLYGITAGEQH